MVLLLSRIFKYQIRGESIVTIQKEMDALRSYIDFSLMDVVLVDGVLQFIAHSVEPGGNPEEFVLMPPKRQPESQIAAQLHRFFLHPFPVCIRVRCGLRRGDSSSSCPAPSSISRMASRELYRK